MSATGKHTPGRLAVSGVRGAVTVRGQALFACTEDRKEINIAQVDGHSLQPDGYANALRLRDCWNACEGLNPTAIKDVVAALKAFVNDQPAITEGDAARVKKARAALSALRTDTDEVKS